MKSPTTWTARAAGRPDGERRAADAVELAHVRAEARPQLLVAALADQVQVELAERRQEAVGVVERDRAEVGVVDLERVVQRQLGPVDEALEHAAGVDLLERDRSRPSTTARTAAAAGRRARIDHAVGVRMGAEDRVRVVVLAADEALEIWGGGDGHRLRLPFPASGLA